MIVLISTKDFLEKPKKFYKMRATHIINGSDSSDLGSFGEVDAESGGGLNTAFIPHKSVINGGTGLSKDERERKTKRFLKNADLTRRVAAAVAYQVREPDSNVFIVINKKVYKVLGDKLIKRFNKLVKTEEGELFFDYNDFESIRKIYRKMVGKKLDKYNEKYDKLMDSDKSDKIADLNDMLDKLEDAYDAPDNLEARKVFLKEALPSKDTMKKMKKFLKENEDIFNSDQYELANIKD